MNRSFAPELLYFLCGARRNGWVLKVGVPVEGLLLGVRQVLAALLDHVYAVKARTLMTYSSV